MLHLVLIHITMSLVHLIRDCRQVDMKTLVYKIEGLLEREEATLDEIWEALKDQLPPEQLTVLQERVNASATWSDLDKAELALAQTDWLDLGELPAFLPLLLLRALIRAKDPRLDAFVTKLRAWTGNERRTRELLELAADLGSIVRDSGEWNHYAYAGAEHISCIENALLSAVAMAGATDEGILDYLSEDDHCCETEYITLSLIDPVRLDYLNSVLEEREEDEDEDEFADY